MVSETLAGVVAEDRTPEQEMVYFVKAAWPQRPEVSSEHSSSLPSALTITEKTTALTICQSQTIHPGWLRCAKWAQTLTQRGVCARSSAHAQLCNTGMMVMCHEMMCIMTDSVNHSSYAGITAGTPFPVETMLPRARARPHVDESPRASHLDVALALASVFFNANSATGRVAEWRNLQRHASRQGRGGVSIGSGPPMLSEVAREGSTWESRGSR